MAENESKSLLERMREIDRRWIFLFMALAAMVPFAFDIAFTEVATPEVQAVFDLIEKHPEGAKVLVPLDFDPPSEPELKPMATSYVRHLCKKKQKIYFMSLWPVGPAEIVAMIEEVIEKYPDDVKFIFMHFPLGFHPWAKPASIAANCAGNQNHDDFWVLHDAYFKDQKQLTPDNVVAKSREYLKGSKIDMAVWETCAADTNSDEYKAEAKKVDDDMALGQEMGVSGTPGFFINGEFLNGAQPVEQFVTIIEKAKAGS